MNIQNVINFQDNTTARDIYLHLAIPGQTIPRKKKKDAKTTMVRQKRRSVCPRVWVSTPASKIKQLLPTSITNEYTNDKSFLFFIFPLQIRQIHLIHHNTETARLR